MTDALPDGRYDQLVTRALHGHLASVEADVHHEPVSGDDEVEFAVTHLTAALRRALAQRKAGADRAALVEAVAEVIEAEDEAPAGDRLERLVSVITPPAIGLAPRYRTGPNTPLGESTLLTNAHGEPSMGMEISRELDSADEVDLLCAFIKFAGLRTMERELRPIAQAGVPFRIITTTYMGATERRALDWLVQEFGAQVKVHYESRSTRLHAKAWMFRRRTGFHTAYVGSSNLSRSALLDGLEWNVRITQAGTPHLLEKFRATFDSYWNDPSFEDYDPAEDGERLDEALLMAGGKTSSELVMDLSGLRHRPYPYQQEMLDALEAERVVHDRHRNLLVAATGTGKTVVAAFDYRNLSEASTRPPRLLFIAHRLEILDQARRTFREILGDGTFGEIYGFGRQPTRWDHVFATVQSLSGNVEDLPADHFDVVIVDEFHHAEAATYRRVLDHFTPREMLGLTATPERADGVRVQDAYFDGRTAFELRLWDALAGDLLAPFHYFGIADSTDLTQVRFQRGSYDTDQLTALYTGNQARARIILKAVRDKVADPRQMRAIGFCVGVDHARFMAAVFTEAGLPARALTGESSAEQRAETRAALISGDICAIFTADLFNEGVDIPQVDTVLFLRPTDSATIFLQQLGRGLRRHPSKAVLTALDFVGHQHEGFRLERRFMAMTGATRGELQKHAEHGFPLLPAGSQIVLDDVTYDEVISSLKASLTLNKPRLVASLRAYSDISLADFADALGTEAERLVKNASWTDLRRQAGLSVDDRTTPDEAELLRRRHMFFRVDDRARLDAYRAWLSADAPAYGAASPELQRFGRMLHGIVWPKGGRTTWADGLAHLASCRPACDEFLAILDIAEDRIRHVSQPLPGPLSATGLASHATYAREEILAALDQTAEASQTISHREGVYWSPTWQTDALLVTLKKSDALFSPSTMYHDYAMGPEVFHWQSQSRTTPISPTGQRYIHHQEQGSHVVLFARTTSTRDEFGHTPGFMCLGTARYRSSEGSAPMSVIWELDRPLPADMYQAASAAA
ncbi:DUF3427 domain-containing protein [Kytococcus schroeteri]|uniref:DUF3427 domain-containing protein n=1 Tax=Kytococcus schroeteri TaxID=138300 RepID=UPI0035E73F5D